MHSIVSPARPLARTEQFRPLATTRCRKPRRSTSSSSRMLDRAKDGQRRLAKVAREEHANDRLVTRGNVLTVGPRQTPAQARIVDECLKESSA